MDCENHAYIPVSYTHLDLYKRQCMDLIVLVQSKKGRLVDLAIGLGPVSYTHLDVYKRQELGPSASVAGV